MVRTANSSAIRSATSSSAGPNSPHRMGLYATPSRCYVLPDKDSAGISCGRCTGFPVQPDNVAAAKLTIMGSQACPPHAQHCKHGMMQNISFRCRCSVCPVTCTSCFGQTHGKPRPYIPDPFMSNGQTHGGLTHGGRTAAPDGHSIALAHVAHLTCVPSADTLALRMRQLPLTCRCCTCYRMRRAAQPCGMQAVSHANWCRAWVAVLIL